MAKEIVAQFLPDKSWDKRWRVLHAGETAIVPPLYKLPEVTRGEFIDDFFITKIGRVFSLYRSQLFHIWYIKIPRGWKFIKVGFKLIGEKNFYYSYASTRDKVNFF